MTSRPARVPGRLIAWAALLVALGASVGANIGAARPDLGPRLVAPVAPVIALLGAALLERVSLAGTRWWQKGAIAGGLPIVVALAFVTSYQHQQELLTKYGNAPLSAALLPVAVDVLVLMASVALAVIGQQRRAARAALDAQTWPARPAQVAPAVAPVPASPQVIHPAPVAPEVAAHAGEEPTNGARRPAALPVTKRAELLAELVASGKAPKPAEAARILGTDNLSHVTRTLRDATNGGRNGVTRPGDQKPTAPPPRPRPRREERSESTSNIHAGRTPAPNRADGRAGQPPAGPAVDDPAGVADGPADPGPAAPEQDG
jgi:hypothetical protein